MHQMGGSGGRKRCPPLSAFPPPLFSPPLLFLSLFFSPSPLPLALVEHYESLYPLVSSATRGANLRSSTSGTCSFLSFPLVLFTFLSPFFVLSRNPLSEQREKKKKKIKCVILHFIFDRLRSFANRPASTQFWFLAPDSQFFGFSNFFMHVVMLG